MADNHEPDDFPKWLRLIKVFGVGFALTMFGVFQLDPAERIGIVCGISIIAGVALMLGSTAAMIWHGATRPLK